MADQEDVEQFLWDFERELAHLSGEKRRELLKQAEDLLHEAATEIAQAEGAEQVRWFHYVQATAEIGPPEALAAHLTGEPLPDRDKRHRQLWAAAAVLVLGVLALIAFAWFTTGSLEPIDAWSGQEEDLRERRELAFNVSQQADSVFLSLAFTPAFDNASARVTVLDGNADVVYQGQASASDHLETAEFVEGAAGRWLAIIDFDNYTGGWRLEVQEEVG